MNDEPFLIRKVGQNKIVFLINCRGWNTSNIFQFFHISQRAVLIHPLIGVPLQSASFHFSSSLTKAQFALRPDIPALSGSPERQSVKTTLLKVDSRSHCPSEWRSVMPSQKLIFREKEFRLCISATMALFSSAESISTRRAGTCCSSSQNFLASLCVIWDSWNLGGKEQVTRMYCQRRKTQILLNPLVTCSNLLRAVSKEPDKQSGVLDDNLEELLQEPERQRRGQSRRLLSPFFRWILRGDLLLAASELGLSGYCEQAPFKPNVSGRGWHTGWVRAFGSVKGVFSYLCLARSDPVSVKGVFPYPLAPVLGRVSVPAIHCAVRTSVKGVFPFHLEPPPLQRNSLSATEYIPLSWGLGFHRTATVKLTREGDVLWLTRIFFAPWRIMTNFHPILRCHSRSQQWRLSIDIKSVCLCIEWCRYFLANMNPFWQLLPSLRNIQACLAGTAV